MGGPGGLSAVRRLLGAEVRPGRVFRWFTTRRIMVLVAIVAVGLAAEAMRRRRDKFLFLAGQHRTRELRFREDPARPGAWWREQMVYFRRCIARWIVQAEAIGATDIASRCRGLLGATDRLIGTSPDGLYRADDLIAYRDEVTRLTAGATGGWTPRNNTWPGDKLQPDILGNLADKVGLLTRDAVGATRRIEHHARLAEKYERAASRPWESVGPDPPPPD